MRRPQAEPPEAITSAANPWVKRLRALDTRKGRSETGLFLTEGTRLITQGLARGWGLSVLALSQGALDRPGTNDLITKARAQRARVISLPDRLMESLARKDNPQTALAAFTQRDLALTDLDPAPNGLWLALWEVRDPGNLGTLIRTADCAGAHGLILLGTCCDLYSVECVRATMGSLFDLEVARADFPAFDAWRRAARLSLTAASVNGTMRHDAVPYGPRAALLMGNEQKGLPPALEAACDHLALIPMRGGADSLNLAQAGAIITYEAWRAQGFAGART